MSAMADFFFLTVEFIIIAVAVPGWSLSFYSPSSSSPSPSSSSPSSSSAKTSLVRQTLTIVKSLLVEGSRVSAISNNHFIHYEKEKAEKGEKILSTRRPKGEKLRHIWEIVEHGAIVSNRSIVFFLLF